MTQAMSGIDPFLEWPFVQFRYVWLSSQTLWDYYISCNQETIVDLRMCLGRGYLVGAQSTESRIVGGDCRIGEGRCRPNPAAPRTFIEGRVGS